MRIAIVIPVYNDWASLTTLLSRLTEALRARSDAFRFILVDDASADPPPRAVLNSANLFAETTLLRLQCNLGHQRAIAVGLTWLFHHALPDAVVIMDGDGEDKPEDVPRLLNHFQTNGGTTAVFAARTRRLEGLRFRFFYRLYQMAHRLLTGLPVNIGNFSVVPGDFLRSLVVSSHLWNHYAATVVSLRLRMTTIATTRGVRYQGRSKMSFVSLVRHGVSALAVHSELVAVRLLIATAAFSVLAVALLALSTSVRLFTTLAIPGWATYVTGFILIILIQILSLTFSFTIHAFSDVTRMSFLPTREYMHFIATVNSLPIGPDTLPGSVGTPPSVHV